MSDNWQTTPGVLRIDDKDVVPFMAVKEYEYIRDLINRERFETALEWGAGSSTIWFPKNCDIKYWVSIESDPVYFDYLKEKVGDKVNLLLLKEKQDYINAEYGVLGRPVQLSKVEHESGKFDFILIDGMFRDECLARAFEMLSDHPHSQIILHDAGRKAYHEWYDKYPHKIIFEGEGWLGDGYDHRGLTAFGNYE